MKNNYHPKKGKILKPASPARLDSAKRAGGQVQDDFVLGQTIIELLVALTLITLFLTGVVVIQLYAIKNVQYSQKKSIATKLAQEQLERIRVVRDIAGISSLDSCQSTGNSGCYINSKLEVMPLTPTGTYGQMIQLQTATAADCPPPEVVPAPISYKATVKVSWGQGSIDVTPGPELSLEGCITDWR